MAGTRTFDQLPAGSVPVDADLFAVEQTTTTVPSTNKITGAQLTTYITESFSGQYLPITGGTLTGPLFIPPVPDSLLLNDTPMATQVVPYEDVQIEASYAGTKQFVFLATTSQLTGTYYNGPNNDGQGATLTNNGLLEPLKLDGIIVGISPAPFNRVLVKNQSDPTQNGIYIVTNPGDYSTPWVLERATDFDNSADGQIGPGAMGLIYAGDTQQQQMFVLTTPTPLLIGSNNILFSLVAGSTTTTNSGFASLVNGSATVSYPLFSSSSIVLLTPQQVIGTLGIPYVSSRTIGTGFGIASSSSSDNSVIGWQVNNASFSYFNKGQVSLVAGSATVNATAVSSSSVIILTVAVPINSPGKVVVTATTPGTSFTISSGYASDTSLVNWAIYDYDYLLSFGKATLAGGTASVALSDIQPGDIILLTIQSPSATIGDISIGTVTPGTGFTIISNYPLDTSIVGWVRYPSTTSVPSGREALIAGRITIANGAITSGSVVLLTSQIPSLTFGSFALGTVTVGISFVVNSTYGADTSTIGYIILN